MSSKPPTTKYITDLARPYPQKKKYAEKEQTKRRREKKEKLASGPGASSNHGIACVLPKTRCTSSHTDISSVVSYCTYPAVSKAVGLCPTARRQATIDGSSLDEMVQ